MEIVKGLLYINSIDVYEAYGAYLCEDKQGDTSNYSSILKLPGAKEHKAIDLRENSGVKLPTTLQNVFKAREITLKFAIEGEDANDFLEKYYAFIKMLKEGDKGWIKIHLPELKQTFRTYYLECTEWKQLTGFEDKVYAKFSVKFKEPNPFEEELNSV